jgi:hypothetical protein
MRPFLLGHLHCTPLQNDYQKCGYRKKVIKIRSIKDSVTGSTKERNPLEINRIPQVIVNTIKTAKKMKK